MVWPWDEFVGTSIPGEIVLKNCRMMDFSSLKVATVASLVADVFALWHFDIKNKNPQLAFMEVVILIND